MGHFVQSFHVVSRAVTFTENPGGVPTLSVASIILQKKGIIAVYIQIVSMVCDILSLCGWWCRRFFYMYFVAVYFVVVSNSSLTI